jgi:hypothetical protein
MKTTTETRRTVIGIGTGKSYKETEYRGRISFGRIMEMAKAAEIITVRYEMADGKTYEYESNRELGNHVFHRVSGVSILRSTWNSIFSMTV